MQIEDRYASGLHARVFSRDGRHFVEDMRLHQRNAAQRRHPEGRGGADRRRRGEDRRHRVQIRGRLMLRVDDQAFRTDTGRQRNANEDSFFARAPGLRRRRRDGRRPGRRGRLEGGGRGVRPRPPRRAPERVLRETIEAANREIHEHARADPALTGMGTTITAAIVNAAGRRGRDRPRRRQPRLPPARRQAGAADPRPLAGRGDAAQGPADRRPGRGPPAALDHHPRPRPRARGRGRRADGPRPDPATSSCSAPTG